MKLLKKLSFLDFLFIAQLIVVGLVITGTVSRTIVPYFVIVLIAYVIFASLENASIFFIRSIPFFIAIPLTANFDSLNTWRILSGLIFIKWLLQKEVLQSLLGGIKLVFAKPMAFIKKYPVSSLLFPLLILSALSVLKAGNHTLAFKRIIYFINLSLVGIVIFDLVKKKEDFGQRAIRNIAIPTILVALIGFAQLISTYYMDIFRFVDLWTQKVEFGLFGQAWANTALHANTWFAYFGDQLSLRMFSVFPDSHSFPIFLLFGLPSVFAVALYKVVKNANGLKTMAKTRSSLLIVFVPVIYLAMILTGTRGIWAASAGAVIVILGAMYLFKKHAADKEHKDVFKYISSYVLLFFILFGVAYPIFASSQFQVSKSDSALLAKRVRSVLDITETSNARRIEIWKASIRSIIKHPLLGVGIGNFPVVVGESLTQAKAGSSAHNLYLNIAAETGILSLVFALWFLLLLLKKTYDNFLGEKEVYSLIYNAAALIYIPWVLVYSLTDPAIFDERAFLLFVVTAGLILSIKKSPIRAE
jgi:O-antigen ligase